MRVSTAKDAVVGIDRSIDEMARILDALRDETSVLESRWDGEAREAMSIAVRDWSSSIELMRLVGRDASRVAGETIERVDAFDRRRAGVWYR